MHIELTGRMDEKESSYLRPEKLRKLLESDRLPLDDYLEEEEEDRDFEEEDGLVDDDEDWILQKRWNSMLEIFAIIYLGRDDIEPRNQLGRIYMYSPVGILDIYNVDKVDETRETIKHGDEFDIMDIKGPVPYHNECSSMMFDLFRGAYKGHLYESFSKWQFISRDDAYLKKLVLDSINGRGTIVILMGLYAHATIAHVEVRLDSTYVAPNIYGSVSASNSQLDSDMATSFLFLKQRHKGIIVGTDGLIPLSRSRVAVQFESELFLDIDLVVDGQLLHTTKSFSARKTGVYTKNFKNLLITVKWDALYYESNKEVDEQGKKA